MSHLSTLVERVERAIDHLEIPRDLKDRETRLKQRIANIIEYIYFFRQNIEKKEITQLINELDGLKGKELKEYDEMDA
jgi:hypothetical protein